MTLVRNSQRRCSMKKVVIKNFAKFTGKHLYQSLFFNKVVGLRPIEKGTLAQVFSSDFCEDFKNTFFTEHLRVTASVWSCFIPHENIRNSLVVYFIQEV